MLNLNDMMVFLAVVESGSFTAAAQRLAMPKANVSRKIAKLESTLGITLLERTTRSQKLTEAGKHYIAHCKRISEEAALANAVIDKARNTVSGEVKVGASVSIGQEILKPKITEFLSQYPELSLQLNLTNQRVDLVEGGFDMLVRIGKLEDSNLIAKKLGCATRGLYASPKYLNALATKPEIKSLDTLNWLVMSSSISVSGITLLNQRQAHEVSFSPKLVVDDFSVIKQACIDGLGITALPNYMCQDDVNSGRLVKVLRNWQLTPSDMYAIYPRNRINLPKIKILLQFLESVFREKLAC